MVSAKGSENNFGSFDMEDADAEMEKIFEDDQKRQEIVTFYRVDQCYKCKCDISDGQAIGIHKPYALVYSHILLSSEEVIDRQKALA